MCFFQNARLNSFLAIFLPTFNVTFLSLKKYTHTRRSVCYRSSSGMGVLWNIDNFYLEGQVCHILVSNLLKESLFYCSYPLYFFSQPSVALKDPSIKFNWGKKIVLLREVDLKVRPFALNLGGRVASPTPTMLGLGRRR